ncbi:MAG: hypothetical protein Q8920_13635 [Bacillota bacterium]|nr:hypothetical protein [Bacillota bacterium]
MSKIHNFFLRLSNKKVLLILFILVVLLVIIPDFIKVPVGPLKFEEYSHGIKMIDMTTNYSPSTVYNMVENYGAKARNYYIYVMEPFDVLVPAIMGLFLAGTITLLFKKANKHKLVLLLQVIPLLGWVFDYLENIGVITILVNYPHKLITVVKAANLFTTAKGIFDTAGICIVCIGLILWVYDKTLRPRHQNKTVT